MRLASVMRRTMRHAFVRVKPGRRNSSCDPFHLTELLLAKNKEKLKIGAPGERCFMTSYEFEHFVLPRFLEPLLAGLLLAAAFHASAQAAPEPVPMRSYVISVHDGYGVLECLTQSKDCGKFVADSWCETHGHRRALAYGRAEDITGATDATTPEPVAATVTCGE
jgi:hypothetical protein